MTVTIIGSMSIEKTMDNVKKFFEKLGFTVNSPNAPGREHLSLYYQQSTWIGAIQNADFIVAIPKNIITESDGGSNFQFEFGESTTYEMAIAVEFQKPILVWTFPFKDGIGTIAK